MIDKLPWAFEGQAFEGGSELSDWAMIYQSPDWHWQFDSHALTFAIYEHDGQFWKLYRALFVEPGAHAYSYDYGGVACRMVRVEYLSPAGSPHSSVLRGKGEQEWIRTYEYDPNIHKVLRAGDRNDKYGEPYETRQAA